jgi:hypothetical protein
MTDKEQLLEMTKQFFRSYTSNMLSITTKSGTVYFIFNNNGELKDIQIK